MRRTRSLATALVAGAALALATALPAAAHNYVVSSTPEAGETLTAVPEFFVITTNEQLLDLTGEAAGFGMQVTDENGLFYGDGCVDVSGASMATAGALGAAGDYTLTYQFVSSDGHTLSDTLSFRYEPTEGASAEPGADAAPVCGGAEATGGEQVAGESADEATTVTGLIVGLIVGLGLLAAMVAFFVRRSRSAEVSTE